MIYDVRQETIYHYDSPVAYAHHVLRLTPIDRAHQRVHAAALDITPTPIERREGQDFFGNRITWIAFDQPHDTLTVRVAARIAVEQAVAVEAGATPPWEEVREAAFASADPSPQAPAHYLFPSRQVSLDPEIRDYVTLSFPPGRTILDGATDLMNRIKAEFVYEVGATTASTTPPMSFALRRGVCQDFTHIMISGMRSLGLPVAYVSGYLRTVQSRRRNQARRRRRHARLGAGLVRDGRGLDRLRSDQRHPRRPRPRRARDRPRLRRRGADRRRHLRLRRAAAGNLGARRAGRLIVKRHKALQRLAFPGAPISARMSNAQFRNYGFDFSRPRSRAERIARLDALATLLDTAFVVPGTNIRFGIDAMIGLVPGIGDAITTADVALHRARGPRSSARRAT